MDDDQRTTQDDGAVPANPGAAARALAEAEERRRAAKRVQGVQPREINGRQGPEPVRYGDWENKGIAYDF